MFFSPTLFLHVYVVVKLERKVGEALVRSEGQKVGKFLHKVSKNTAKNSHIWKRDTFYEPPFVDICSITVVSIYIYNTSVGFYFVSILGRFSCWILFEISFFGLQWDLILSFRKRWACLGSTTTLTVSGRLCELISGKEAKLKKIQACVGHPVYIYIYSVERKAIVACHTYTHIHQYGIKDTLFLKPTKPSIIAIFPPADAFFPFNPSQKNSSMYLKNVKDPPSGELTS